MSAVFALCCVGLVVLDAGMLCLGVAVVRERVLPPWSGQALLAAVVTFAPLVVAPGPAVEASTTVGPVLLHYEDVLSAVTALAWTLLGVGQLSVVRDQHPGAGMTGRTART